MGHEVELANRVVSTLQELAEQEKEAVSRSAQRARQRLLDQKVGPAEARDQLQLFAMGEASAHQRAAEYAVLAQQGKCPACWVWKSSTSVLNLSIEGGALHATCPVCRREWVVQVSPGQTSLWKASR